MAYVVHWQSSHVICARLQGRVTIGDLYGAKLAICHLAELGRSPINVLFDIREVDSLPANLRVIQRYWWDVEGASMGWVLVVGTQPWMANLAALLWQLSRIHYKLFDTMDDAQAFLDALSDNAPSGHHARG